MRGIRESKGGPVMAKVGASTAMATAKATLPASLPAGPQEGGGGQEPCGQAHAEADSRLWARQSGEGKGECDGRRDQQPRAPTRSAEGHGRGSTELEKAGICGNEERQPEAQKPVRITV